MHFAARVRTWRVARLYTVQCTVYNEIAAFRKPFGKGHVYIFNLLLRMTDTMTSQNIDLSSWDTLNICVFVYYEAVSSSDYTASNSRMITE
jgi:hypothetical protein